LVKVLGVEKFGLLAFITVTVGYFEVLIEYGFGLTATKDIASSREDKEALSRIVSSVLLIKLFFIGISLILLTLFLQLSPRFLEDSFVYYVSFFALSLQLLSPQWFFMGMERMHMITLFNVGSKLFFTLLIFMVVQEESDYWKVPLVQLAGVGMVAMVSFIIVFFYEKIHFRFDREKIEYYLKYNFSFFLSRVAVHLYTHSNIFFLGLFAGNSVVGYYSIAQKIAVLLQSFYTLILQVIYPYMARVKNSLFLKRILSISTLVNAMLLTLLYFFSDRLFQKLFGLGECCLNEVFHILLLSNLFTVPSLLLGYPFLGVLGYEKEVNLSVMYGALLHLLGLGILLFLERFNLYSVAMMMVVTEVFVLLYRGYSIYQKRVW
jgi:PST family polysaccharide transporter